MLASFKSTKHKIEPNNPYVCKTNKFTNKTEDKANVCINDHTTSTHFSTLGQKHALSGLSKLRTSFFTLKTGRIPLNMKHEGQTVKKSVLKSNHV